MADLVINFLDVGQGDGTFIVCPTGEKILIDFGTVKNSAIAVPDAMTFLKTQFTGNKNLDLLVVTHADRDHYNRIEALFTELNLTVTEVWISGAVNDYYMNSFSTFLTGLGTKVKTFPANYHTKKDFSKADKTFGGVKFFILSVNLNYDNYGDPNPYSLVLMVTYKGVACVLPGDATFDTENAIIGYFGAPKLASYALKMGHHGSAVTSSGPPWIKAIKPEALFVSADNKFNHPSCAVINQFTNIGTWKQHAYYCYDVDNLTYHVVNTAQSICTSMLSEFQGVQYALYIQTNGGTAIGDTNY
jgi:beta-lactamase superfamily II metal-dependent hydrolase